LKTKLRPQVAIQQMLLQIDSGHAKSPNFLEVWKGASTLRC